MPRRFKVSAAASAQVKKRRAPEQTEPLRTTMTLRHLLMHTSGIGYGPGAITPGVSLVARTPEETGTQSHSE